MPLIDAEPYPFAFEADQPRSSSSTCSAISSNPAGSASRSATTSAQLRRTIEPTARLLDAARGAGMR